MNFKKLLLLFAGSLSLSQLPMPCQETQEMIKIALPITGAALILSTYIFFSTNKKNDFPIDNITILLLLVLISLAIVFIYYNRMGVSKQIERFKEMLIGKKDTGSV